MRIGDNIMLTEADMEKAKEVISDRNEVCAAYGAQDKRVDQTRTSREITLEGTMGEIAFCKIAGTKPDFSNTFKNVDTTLEDGRTVDVKSAAAGLNLIVPQWQGEEKPLPNLYALMTHNPFSNKFMWCFKGVMESSELIQKRRLKNLGHDDNIPYFAHVGELVEI